MNTSRFASFDLLATPVAVLDTQGAVLFVNAALEDTLGQSRRSLLGQALVEHFVEAPALQHALQGVRDNAFAVLRYEAALRRLHHVESLPVHVVIAPSDRADEVIVELFPVVCSNRHR
jgi:two-component system, NtrC family, nitrogen regulation sensor histidine kinase GlnL